MSTAVDTHTQTSAHAALIARAEDFPMEEVLKRYVKDKNLPLQVAHEHERELKRFLALCALNPKGSYGMAGPVDELWHTFLLFTKNYAFFCDEVAGVFLHHVPNTAESRRDITSYNTGSSHKCMHDSGVVSPTQASA